MTTEAVSKSEPSSEAPSATPRPEHLEFWKHFAAMGAADKNTMVVTASWLIGLAGAGIAYVVTELLSGTMTCLQKERTIAASLVGLLISIGAALVAVIYGGYSNRNWAEADRIARRYGWNEVLPEHAPEKMTPQPNVKVQPLAEKAWTWARPSYPENVLAPIFWFFLAFATVAALVNAGFLLWATLSRYFLSSPLCP